jgi:ribonuclease HI
MKSRLESQGPLDDTIRPQVQLRADLRAVVGALRYQNWAKELFEKVIITTESQYVFMGATGDAREWARQGWPSNRRDQDLWQVLLGEIDKASENGVTIHMWLVKPEYNAVASNAALSGALLADLAFFTDLLIEERPLWRTSVPLAPIHDEERIKPFSRP